VHAAKVGEIHGSKFQVPGSKPCEVFVVQAILKFGIELIGKGMNFEL
jgi:hypothetical protein